MRSRRSRRFASRLSAYSAAVTPSIPGAPSLRVSRKASLIHSKSMTWCSVDKATPRFDLASSAIRCRFVYRFVRLKVLSCVPSAVLSTRRLPSLDWVPMSSVPQRHEHYEGATTSTRRITGHLFVSLPVPTSVLLGSCSLLAALPGERRSRGGPGSLFSRRSSLPARSHVDVSGTSQVPRRPFLCLCPVPRPRSNRRSSPISVPSMLPLRPSQQRLRHCSYRGYHGASAPAVYASRTVLPPPHARLASGWLAGLYRVGVEPTGSQ